MVNEYGVHPSVSKDADFLVDTYLGKDYDPVKRDKLKKLQASYMLKHMQLADKHDRGEINDFNSAMNQLLASCFDEVKELLGEEDYNKVFKNPSHPLPNPCVYGV